MSRVARKFALVHVSILIPVCTYAYTYSVVILAARIGLLARWVQRLPFLLPTWSLFAPHLRQKLDLLILIILSHTFSVKNETRIYSNRTNGRKETGFGWIDLSPMEFGKIRISILWVREKQYTECKVLQLVIRNKTSHCIKEHICKFIDLSLLEEERTNWEPGAVSGAQISWLIVYYFLICFGPIIFSN